MADVDKPTTPLIPGTQLGRYRIETLIGTGGMASVYRAFDTVLQRPLAIKVLERTLESAGVDERLLREAQTASALSHSNICTVYEIGSENGLTFIAMEFVDGPALAGTLATGSLSVDDTLRYGIALASALAHAHERGVIHRDLKAANAILSSSCHLKIVDFGLARRLDAVMADAPTLESLAPAGSAIGTPYAMAPEQVRGAPADARSDVWALGVLLYEMVSASRPFEGATDLPEVFASILRDSPASFGPIRVLGSLRLIVDRCLAKDAERRYQRADDVRQALEAIAAGSRSHVTIGPAFAGDAAPLPGLRCSRSLRGTSPSSAANVKTVNSAKHGLEPRNDSVSSCCWPASPASARRASRSSSRGVVPTSRRMCSSGDATRKRSFHISLSSKR